MKTIKYLVDHKAKVILCSHLGRPKGEFNMKYSLAPVAAYLSKALGQEVKMAKDVVGESAKSIAASLQDGEVELIENVRFHKEEEKNDPAFAKELASMAEIYVNDAFGTAHRAHASTAGVADYLPAVCGYLIQKEITIMGGALSDPKRPFVAILGGAKVSDKIGVINNLLDKVDTLIIGGGMAYTFMNALGYSIGTSICEDDKLELAKDMMAKAKEKGVKFLIPGGQRGCRQSMRLTPRPRWSDSDNIPGRLDGPGHRPEDRRAVLRRHQGRWHRCLERTDGRFRVGELCKRHHRRGKGGCRERRNFHHRRRRLCGGC